MAPNNQRGGLSGPLLSAVERRQEWQTKAHTFVRSTVNPHGCEVCSMASTHHVHNTVGESLRFDNEAERELGTRFIDDIEYLLQQSVIDCEDRAQRDDDAGLVATERSYERYVGGL